MAISFEYRKAALSMAISLSSVAGLAAESVGRLEEVIVTAQKRDESIQDIPASITALSTQALETSGIQDLSSLAAYVPSMSVGKLYGSNSVTLRGISTSQTSGSEDPSVAVHVNGVYQARSRALDVAMMELERVEVLSGPQGTLYGRNATGGVVNYITKAPADEWEGSLALGGGNYDTRTVKGSISGPISDELRFRLSGIYDDQGKGYTKNLYKPGPARTLEDTSVLGARLAFNYIPTDALEFDLEMMYVDTDSTTFFGALAPPVDPNSASNLRPQSFKPHEIYTELDPKLDSIVQQVAFTAAWDITDDLQFKSISSYQKFTDQMDIDLDATELGQVSVFQHNWSETVTQEFNLTAHLLDGQLTSIFGIFLYGDRFNSDAVVGFFTEPLLGGFPLTINPGRMTTKSYSAFTDQTFEVNDRLRLIAGIRFNRDEKEGRQIVARPCVGTSAAGCPLIKRELDWTAWTPKFGIQYDLSHNVMVYAQYQKGFKSGGFVSNTAGDEYDPEFIKGPEIGIKSTLLDGRLRLNAAAWDYSYTDLQVQQVVGVGQFAVNNAAEAKLRGLEISAQALLTSRLSIDFAGMVQSAKYDKFDNCNQTVFAGACSTPETTVNTDVSDNWLNRAPPYSANIGLQYTFDLPNGAELLVRGESYWSGFVYYDEFNSRDAKQDAYSVQNVFATFTPAEGNYTARAYVKNLGDEDHLVSAFWNSAGSQFTGNWAPPRTYGAEVTLRF